MAKLIIFSIVLVSFGVPIWFSASPKPRKELRRTQLTVLVFILVWAYLCLSVYPRLVSYE